MRNTGEEMMTVQPEISPQIPKIIIQRKMSVSATFSGKFVLKFEPEKTSCLVLYFASGCTFLFLANTFHQIHTSQDFLVIITGKNQK